MQPQIPVLTKSEKELVSNLEKSLVSIGNACVFSNPELILQNINMIKFFENEKEKITPYDFGKLLTFPDFQKENYFYSIVAKTNSTHIPKLLFAGSIGDQRSVQLISTIKKCDYIKEHPTNKFGYLIFRNVGITFEKYDINHLNIINILQSLIVGIKSFVEPLNTPPQPHYHCDLNPRNITYNENEKKVYFIDFGTLLPETLLRDLTDIYELTKLVHSIFFYKEVRTNFNMKRNFLHQNTNTPAHRVVKMLHHPSFDDPRRYLNYDSIKTHLSKLGISNHDGLISYLIKIIKSLQAPVAPVPEPTQIQV